MVTKVLSIPRLCTHNSAKEGPRGNLDLASRQLEENLATSHANTICRTVVRQKAKDLADLEIAKMRLRKGPALTRESHRKSNAQ